MLSWVRQVNMAFIIQRSPTSTEQMNKEEGKMEL
jgi:hypothetical protein